MAYRYWSMMTDKKFALIYLGLHYHKNVQIERWMNIILAIISTGSLGALLFFDQHQYILTIILALAQIVTAARPYLPYQYRMQEIEKGLLALNDLYNDIEEKWLSIASGKLTDEEINNIYYSSVRKWDELDSKILKKDSLPRRKKFIKQANDEKEMYFTVMFGGDTNE